jgi:hypothetical protein
MRAERKQRSEPESGLIQAPTRSSGEALVSNAFYHIADHTFPHMSAGKEWERTSTPLMVVT